MALVVRDGKPAGPRPEDELIGLPYLDTLSPEEQAVATDLVKAEVIKLYFFFSKLRSLLLVIHKPACLVKQPYVVKHTASKLLVEVLTHRLLLSL